MRASSLCVGSKIAIQWIFPPLPCATWTIQLQRFRKSVQPLLIGPREKPSGFTGHTGSQCHSCEPQTKASPLICCRLIVEPCEVVITVHLIWCVIIFYIISEETSIFAPQRLRFYRALGGAACTVGKVRASTVFMCVCSMFRPSDF